MLAEALGGSEETFAQQMNREAQRLGMRNTQFRNATGLPDPEHYSTARDMATLAARLIATTPTTTRSTKREYTFNNIRQPNRNRLLAIDPSVDGKDRPHRGGRLLPDRIGTPQATGLDAERRLISVVIGASSESARAIESQKLLNYASELRCGARLRKGPAGRKLPGLERQGHDRGGFDSDLVVTVPRGQADKVKAEIERVQPLVALIAQGQKIGTRA